MCPVPSRIYYPKLAGKKPVTLREVEDRPGKVKMSL